MIEKKGFKLIKAGRRHKAAIKNLMQYYIYDFSEYMSLDVENDGLFRAYPNLKEYWRNKNYRFPYLILKNEKYIGFALVKLIESKERIYFSMAEFFIMKKYRRTGAGKWAATQLFNLYKGQWEVYQQESNPPAMVFWQKVIAEYTKGQFKERREKGRKIQDFESVPDTRFND